MFILCPRCDGDGVLWDQHACPSCTKAGLENGNGKGSGYLCEDGSVASSYEVLKWVMAKHRSQSKLESV